jgi:hypothetical protein
LRALEEKMNKGKAHQMDEKFKEKLIIILLLLGFLLIISLPGAAESNDKVDEEIPIRDVSSLESSNDINNNETKLDSFKLDEVDETETSTEIEELPNDYYSVGE